MESFHTFLSPEALTPFDSIEASDEFFTGVDELIHLWLKRYIEIYDPGFRFEEVANSIDSVSVTDELIWFTILNPYSHIQESFRFWLWFLEEIQEEANYELKKLSSNKASFKEQVFPIIQSYRPDITLDKIITVSYIYLTGKTSYHSLDDKSGHDYLWMEFSGENNTPEVITIPYIFKWEYIWSINGNVRKVHRDMEKTGEILDSIMGRAQEILDFIEKKNRGIARLKNRKK